MFILYVSFLNYSYRINIITDNIAIVKYKTSYYSFYLPFAAGMLAAGRNPKCPVMESILFEMGHYFQVQDDYLDCYGDPKVTGKIGTDIQVWNPKIDPR